MGDSVMSYERQRTVVDGDEVIKQDDHNEREPTHGILLYTESPDGQAEAMQSGGRGTKVHDMYVYAILGKILAELRILNQHLSTITDIETKGG